MFFHPPTQDVNAEERLSSQSTRTDDRAQLVPTSPMEYPQGGALQEQLQRKLKTTSAATATSSVGNADTSANSGARPLPIDIDALLAKIVPYRDTLDHLLKENIYPAGFLSETGERFIPCIIAMENARAEENARKLKNPALATELAYFDETRDLLQHAHALHVKHAPGRPERTLHGVVQTDETAMSHSYYCNVLINENSATNIGIESAHKGKGETLLEHLNREAANFPGVKNVVIATDIHKFTPAIYQQLSGGMQRDIELLRSEQFVQERVPFVLRQALQDFPQCPDRQTISPIPAGRIPYYLSKKK